MKALYIERHGAIDDLKISDVPVPLPKAGEVLVRVAAAGINPSDIVSVEGRFPHAVLPRIVGRDFAGTVIEGPEELLGRKIWGTGGDLGIDRDGTHAQYLAIPAKAAAPRPAQLSAQEAATVGVPFITAYSALVTLAKAESGEWVIISGAAGAVGHAAIQLAHANGAHVIALVRDAAEEERLRNFAGVGAIARSDQANLESVVREATDGRGADVALNGVGASILGGMLGALAVGGRVVVYSAVAGREFTVDLLSLYRGQVQLLGLDTQKLDASACAEILNRLAPMFESGTLTPLAVGQRYPLAEAPKAYQQVAAHKGGKIVLTMI